MTGSRPEETREPGSGARGWAAAVRGMRVRPSNLVLLAALPFAVYLFATVDKYTRSLLFIVGVGDNAGAIFIIFLVLSVGLLGGLAMPVMSLKPASGPAWPPMWRWGLLAAAVAHAPLLLIAAFGMDLSAFWNSVASNVLDARESALVVPGARPFTLTEAGQATLTGWLRTAVPIYLVAWAVTIVIMVKTVGKTVHQTARRAHFGLALAVNGGALAYLLLFAHLGFASGLFVTVRAALIAYAIAAVLGLGLAGLMGFTLKRGTIRNTAVLALVSGLIAVALFTRPTETFVLIGDLDARVAIIEGTPQRLTDRIRFGDYEDASSTDVSIRSVASVERALDLMATTPVVSGAFLPLAAVPRSAQVVWQVSFLEDKWRTPGFIAATLSVFLLVLIVGAWQSGIHPLAIFAEFFVDLVRGVPMLVIILYIGLPLSGAIKETTGGAIDLPNMTRGIIAIAVGYSAFMAEIFRAGIEAVPRGQIEAAHSVGLSRWQTARLVILPQAIRIVIPPLGNEFIAMLKDTSLLSILSVRDLTQRTREFQSSSFLPFAPFNTAAVVYVVLTLAASSLLKWAERRGDRRGGTN